MTTDLWLTFTAPTTTREIRRKQVHPIFYVLPAPRQTKHYPLLLVTGTIALTQKVGDKMIVTEFDREDTLLKVELADMLAATWPQSYGQTATTEVDHLMAPDRLAIAAIDDDELVGFVGAIPQYGVTGWELHPLIVRDSHRKRRIGARLMTFIENEIASRGGLTVYLGTDDEKFETSLSEGDLFQNPLQAIQEIENRNHHPYEFYQKLGYQIVGVIPDANGWHKPDILMAKRVASLPNEE